MPRVLRKPFIHADTGNDVSGLNYYEGAALTKTGDVIVSYIQKAL